MSEALTTKALMEMLFDLEEYKGEDSLEVTTDTLRELIHLSILARKYEDALVRIKKFSNVYTTANNFEDVEPEMVANEVYEMTSVALSEDKQQKGE